jgi:hypothetical protein
LSSQRVKFRGGRLESDRIRKLVSIGCSGFVDEVKTQTEIRYSSFDEKNSPQDGTKQRKTWEAHYMELQAYREVHGHAVVRCLMGDEFATYEMISDCFFLVQLISHNN